MTGSASAWPSWAFTSPSWRGKQSYNFPSEAVRTEHYDTIHRATIGEPA